MVVCDILICELFFDILKIALLRIFQTSVYFIHVLSDFDSFIIF